VTRTAEHASVIDTAARTQAADGGTALARRRSAAAAAVPLPLKPGRGTSAISSPAHARTPSSRPALCCFIATVPRSGSWLLSEALFNAGVAGHPHEYFRPDFRDVWASEWRLPQHASIGEYIAAAKERTRTANGVFSAKLHWYQLVWLYGALAPGAIFTRALAAETLEARFAPLQYVFLWRRETARQAISYYRASRTQKWFAKDAGGDEFGAEPVDLQQIRWFEDIVIEHRRNWRQYFAAGGIDPIEVQYEDLASAYEETVASLLSQLGIAIEGSLELASQRTLRRQADDRTEAVLEAYLPMRDHLAPKDPAVRWDASAKRFVSGAGHSAFASGIRS
jgi:trehalose 2-sulfotransferase